MCLSADDSMLLVCEKIVHYVEKTLEKEMNETRKWLQANKLSLYLGRNGKYLVWCYLEAEKKHEK